MLNRFLGKAKAKEPAPTLEDTAANIDKRTDHLQSKIDKLDKELLKQKAQLKRMKPGAAKNAAKQRAMRTLKQRNAYLRMRDNQMAQRFNIDNTSMAIQSSKDSQVAVAAMKSASKELKSVQKKIKIDDVEDLHDDMSDLMEDQEEINEVLGRSYGVPEDALDDEDLEAELDALDDELLDDVEEEEEDRSYMLSAASAAKATTQPEAAESEESADVDEYGLPAAPSKVNA